MICRKIIYETGPLSLFKSYPPLYESEVLKALLRPVVSAVPLCPRADTTERLVRPVVSAVPLCPRWIFIVPLYPRADITERLVRPVMSAVPLCLQIILEIHYILNTHPLKLISIHGL